jgi:histidinol-phosphate/aromatic aminotransferase/cobyric acid decarboxylase-like protein
VAPAIAEQLAEVQRLSQAQLRPAYAEAQLELARRYRTAGQLKAALVAAQAASEAFDRQVEVHKSLSELIAPYERARVERATAHDLGLQRDRANFLIAELARGLGQEDLAITHYVMVIQSQPDQPLGQDALEALAAMGFAAPPQQASPTPKP